MFKITELIMIGDNNESYSYKFDNGINYFVGSNNTGKTEFYNFLDYMFGSSVSIKQRPWFKDSLKKAILHFTYNKINYRLTREITNDKCWFSYEDENDTSSISLDEYKSKLQSVFCTDMKALEQLHQVTDEKLTYRSFTVFNFLGEIRQGVLVDFLDKSSDIKYSTKIGAILNYIFNRNANRIFELKNLINSLQNELKKKELIEENNELILQKVNLNLHKLDLKCIFNGDNSETILKEVNILSNSLKEIDHMRTKDITELEVVFNNLDEQIKVYEKYKSDFRNHQYENKNRKKILEEFNDIISDNEDYAYLINPMLELMEDIDNSISFSQYIIKDETISKLKKQRDSVMEEIQKANMQLTRFSYDEKCRAVAIIEDCLSSYMPSVTAQEINELQMSLKKCKTELKNLQEMDDVEKIHEIGLQMTSLYMSAKNDSDFINDDISKTGNTFHIKYIKNRNSLQTMQYDKGIETIYSIGSHARHTLIQLCGYMAFMKMLIEENKYPIIPILVIDHISKPFSEDNIGAIGAVINEACSLIGVDNIQIIMFDDEPSGKLNINPEHEECLISENKTGFNPFYLAN